MKDQRLAIHINVNMSAVINLGYTVRGVDTRELIYLRCVTNHVLCIGEIYIYVASFSNKDTLLNKVASSEEILLIQLPDLGRKGT